MSGNDGLHPKLCKHLNCLNACALPGVHARFIINDRMFSAFFVGDLKITGAAKPRVHKGRFLFSLRTDYIDHTINVLFLMDDFRGCIVDVSMPSGIHTIGDNTPACGTPSDPSCSIKMPAPRPQSHRINAGAHEPPPGQGHLQSLRIWRRTIIHRPAFPEWPLPWNQAGTGQPPIPGDSLPDLSQNQGPGIARPHPAPAICDHPIQVLRSSQISIS